MFNRKDMQNFTYEFLLTAFSQAYKEYVYPERLDSKRHRRDLSTKTNDVSPFLFQFFMFL